MNENTLKLVAAVLLCTSIASGALAVQYNYQYTELQEDYQATLSELENYTVHVDIVIDDGESQVWYNDTRVSVGATLLNATMLVADVQYQVYDFGVFVTAINGLEGDATHFWGWSSYENSWVMGSVGAGQCIVHDGDVFAWTYTSFE